MSDLDLDRPYLLIMASAGSGKTYTLTLAYIRILRRALAAGDAAAIERILATTFTRAAAAEIVARVLETLALAAGKEAERAKLATALNDPSLSADDCMKLLQTAVAHLHRLRICTLDAFLIGAAVAFAPELGIPSAWRIAETAEDRRMRLEAIERVLESHVEPFANRERMISLLIRLNRGSWPREIAPTLASEFDEAYGVFLDAPAEAWELIGPATPPLSAADAGALIAKLDKEIRRLIPRTASTNQPGSGWTKWTDKIMELAQRRDWRSLARDERLTDIGQGGMPKHTIAITRAFADKLRPLATHVRSAALADLQARNIALRDLLAEFDRHYRKLKETRGVFGFDDFTRKLLDASIFDDEEKGRQELFFRLDARISHILLDEFQDTSIGQWKLLHPLVDEILAGAGAEEDRTFLCVGDVKQTLYAWRNAEPRLFGELKKIWTQIEEVPLVKSFRSSPVVIGAVNTVFHGLAGNAVLVPQKDEDGFLAAAAATWAEYFKPHSTVHIGAPGSVRLRTCSGDKTRQREIAAVKLAADLVEERLKASPGEEIAILFRRKKHMPRLLELLHQRHIYAAGEGGSPLTDDPAVCTALSLLHLLDHPGDTAALFHVGTSPLGVAVGIFDAMPARDLAKVLSAIRRQIADAGFSPVLAGWLAGIAPKSTERNCRRFTQLIAAAHGYSGSDAAGFIQSVREQRVEDTLVTRVRVLTIHNAKGRQFGTVILPDLDAKFFARPPDVLARRPKLLDPFDCITRNADKETMSLDPRLEALRQVYNQQKVVEELCGLYVAMTRAKNVVEMIVHPAPPTSTGSDPKMPLSMAGVLRAALTGRATAEPDTILWTAPTSQLPPAIPAPSAAAIAEIPVRILPADPAKLRIRPAVSPSSLEDDGKVDLAPLLSLDDAPAFSFGTLIHRWFEMIEFLGRGGLPAQADLRAAGRALGIAAEQVESALPQFIAACGKPNMKRLLARPEGEVDLWRERSFAVRLPQASGPDVTLGGTFDRVVVTHFFGKPAHAELIDFKTDGVASKTALEEKLARYKPQIESYKQALAALLGLPPNEITAKLAFFQSDTIVPI